MIKRSTLWVMVIASAFAVANLCYNQPLLAAITQSFHVAVQQVGLCVRATAICAARRVDTQWLFVEVMRQGSFAAVARDRKS